MKYDLAFLNESDLIVIQKACEQFPEDKEFRDAILVELGDRKKTHVNRLDTPPCQPP